MKYLQQVDLRRIGPAKDVEDRVLPAWVRVAARPWLIAMVLCGLSGLLERRLSGQPFGQLETGSVAWADSAPPPATDPAIVEELRVQRASSGAWIADASVEAVYDATTGAVLVSRPFDAVARLNESLLGLRSVGRHLQFHLSEERAADAAAYSGLRDRLLRRYRAGADGAGRPSRSIHLERLFGYDVVFPRRDSQPWAAVARPTRFAASAQGVVVELAAVTGGRLRVVLNDRLIPISASVNGTNWLMLDNGVEGDARNLGPDMARWEPAERRELVTSDGTGTVLVRSASYNLSPDEVHGATGLLMAVDPERGLVLTRWNKWQGRWWSTFFCRLSDALFNVGYSRAPARVYVLRSTERVPLGPETMEAADQRGARLVRAMKLNRHPAVHQIDLGRLLDLEQFTPVGLREVRVTPRQTAVLVLEMHTASRGPATLALEFSEEVEVLSATLLGFNADFEAPEGSGTALRIPTGLVQTVE
jgi:hypothetical protein